MTFVSRGTSASAEFQGQEVLSLWDALPCSTRESIRWRHRENYAKRATTFRCTYKNQNFFLVHKWRASVETRLIILRLLRAFSTKSSTSKSGIGKDYLLCLRGSATNTFKCLIKDSPLWHGVMSTTLSNPKDQDDCEKRTLSDQPRLTRIIPIALLGRCGQKPIKDVTSHGTDFETHTNWQGYIEEPAAKYFVVRKACTIALSKAQGTHWNRIKCKEHSGNCPEAVVRQATFNLNSRVWKTLEDSLPKLYCVDLAEACGLCHARKCQFKDIMSEEKVWFAIAQWTFAWETFDKRWNWERTPVWILEYQVPASILLQENAWRVPEIWGGTYNIVPWSPKGMRKRDKKLDSRAAKKGAKKLVSSDIAKILDKERSNCDKRNLWKNNVYSL